MLGKALGGCQLTIGELGDSFAKATKVKKDER